MYSPKSKLIPKLDYEMHPQRTYEKQYNTPITQLSPINRDQNTYQIRVKLQNKYPLSPKHANFNLLEYRPKSFLPKQAVQNKYKNPEIPIKVRQQSSKSPNACKPKSKLKMRKQSQNNIVFKHREVDMFASKKQTTNQNFLFPIPQEADFKYDSPKKLNFSNQHEIRDLSPFSKQQIQRKKKLQKLQKKKASRWSQVNNFEFQQAQTVKQIVQTTLNQHQSLKDRKYSDNNIKKIPSFLRIPKVPRKSCDNTSVDTKAKPKPKDKMAFNNFIIIKQLGKGSYGKVVLALDKASHMVFAIKIISKKEIIQDNMVEQFSRELKIQSFLNHPNIVKVFGYFDDAQSVYIIMQCALGGNVKDQLQKLPKLKSQLYVSIFFYQLCTALSYLHKLTIIHRDLKIQNTIMHQGVIKLCDFGWSVYRGNALRSTFCGTPLYLCPEILMGNEYSQSIDVWSLGIMLYELVYKQNPFKITCEAQLINILNKGIVFDQRINVSTSLKMVIIKCLQKQSKDRPSINELMNFQFVVIGKQHFQLQK